MDNPGEFRFGKWLLSRTGLVFIAFMVIAAFFLIAEHRAHFLGFLPYAPLFLSLLLYLFMRGRHADHGADSRANHLPSAEGKQ